MTNAAYDFFYRQDSIKPALVGLAGPWMSGGVEFNWPQHHRPATWMPTAHSIEQAEDGSVTVWLGDHDPMHRMRGTLGICLRPGSALIEAKARLCNRSPLTRTFLWWANVAAEVHDEYQSFFPPDVNYVADHAARAMSHFPIANNDYYGVDYRPGTDLSWYKNIPVPTSYMVRETGFDFFGGFDHRVQAGFLHIADRHIAPGKKQWTWGNHEFGYAWDRELDDQSRPYVELMAGVYTDNQPDFSYLLPYEVKTFSQFWWPFQNIGPVTQANEQAALSLRRVGDEVFAGAAAAERLVDHRLRLSLGSRLIHQQATTLQPGKPWSWHGPWPQNSQAGEGSEELRRQHEQLSRTHQCARSCRLGDQVSPKPAARKPPPGDDRTTSSCGLCQSRTAPPGR